MFMESLIFLYAIGVINRRQYKIYFEKNKILRIEKEVDNLKTSLKVIRSEKYHILNEKGALLKYETRQNVI